MLDIYINLCYHISMTKVNKQKISKLEKLSLGFEYNVSWIDARKSIRKRTM